MKAHPARRKNQAMTLIELLVVLCIVAFLSALVMPALVSPQRRVSTIGCANNVKQSLLAFKIWAGDNSDKYPMEISVTNGGAMELMETTNAWKAFQVMSNELSTPKVIFCPNDSQHASYATNWGDDLKNKISYFIGVNASETNVNSFLSGDGNFLLNNSPANHGLITVVSNAPLAWDTTRHVSVTKQGWFSKIKTGNGNIGLADGSVQSCNNSGLTNQLRQTGLVTNRLFVP